jgi:hypothetical protein
VTSSGVLTQPNRRVRARDSWHFNLGIRNLTKRTYETGSLEGKELPRSGSLNLLGLVA